MNLVVERPAEFVGELYHFGWRHLPQALREHLWFYAPLALAAALLAAAAADPKNIQSSGLESLAIFPALAAATRLFVPSFRMTPADVGSLIVIWGIQVFAAGLLIGLVVLLTSAASPGFVFLFLIVFPVIIWLGVKFTLTPSFYTLRYCSEGVFPAFSACWQLVETDRWWRIVGLSILVGLTVYLPATIVAYLVGYAVAASHTPLFVSVFAGALIFCPLAIVATVWNQLSLTGMAARILPSESLE